MFRNFIILSFIIFTIPCFAQNPDGWLRLKIKDGCKQIMFNIDDSKEDSVFYAKDKKFSLRLFSCWYSSSDSYSVVTGGDKLYIFSNNSIPYIYWSFGITWNIKIEIKNLQSNKKMIVICKEVIQSPILLNIEFREGIFEVSTNFLKPELIAVKE